MKTRSLFAGVVVLAILMVPTLAAAGPETDGRQSASVTVFSEFDATLQPGVLHGFILGAVERDRAYYAEVTPTEPSVDGAFIERNVVQPEFNGSAWFDVLRLQIPQFMSDLDVRVRVYSIAPPAVMEEYSRALLNLRPEGTQCDSASPLVPRDPESFTTGRPGGERNVTLLR